MKRGTRRALIDRDLLTSHEMQDILDSDARQRAENLDLKKRLKAAESLSEPGSHLAELLNLKKPFKGKPSCGS